MVGTTGFAGTVDIGSMTNRSRRDETRTFEPLIGIPELAEWLGVSSHTVKKWCTRGPATGLVPPMIQVNGQFRFRPEDVRAWLKHHEVR